MKQSSSNQISEQHNWEWGFGVHFIRFWKEYMSCCANFTWLEVSYWNTWIGHGRELWCPHIILYGLFQCAITLRIRVLVLISSCPRSHLPPIYYICVREKPIFTFLFNNEGGNKGRNAPNAYSRHFWGLDQLQALRCTSFYCIINFPLIKSYFIRS